eukprot:CAMPEP_0197945130 /NCGR_PEP_ID=MMETSP1439-20131203/125756_1 /TAXON_ID=66791 /ORGANISM="Gonyaulax spinifera, Strain CCMP409" /LENGTH=461 /DNA_ID=CAMNT_0043568385 /DNA_START=59 /DNA_END=1442 /DNA_ORIENTATION=-
MRAAKDAAKDLFPCIVPTPARRRSSKGSDRAGLAQAKGGAASVEGVPAEAKGLSWPQKFSDKAKGDRVEISEEGALATRTSGVGYGAVFVGPLTLERGSAYFEIEVAEMDPKRLQTLGVGLCTALPGAKAARAERARDMGEGTFMLGYDLPKVFVHGAEVSKISTKEWRPLKEIKAGDRVGLLIQRRTMELTVFVNGIKKFSAAGLGGGQQWPSEVWGIVDLHGNVKSAWLRGPAAERRQLQRNATVAQLPEPAPQVAPDDLGAQLAATQEVGPRPLPAPPADEARDATQGGGAARKSVDGKRAASKAGLDTAGGSKKRMRAAAFPCGCMVHLLKHTEEVVHVPREGEFIIGRNQKACNLFLDSVQVPKMVSRKHAILASVGDAVVLQDCKSVNGTYVNGRAVGTETLRQGDEVVIGNPTQSPAELKLRVAMPSAAEVRGIRTCTPGPARPGPGSGAGMPS